MELIEELKEERLARKKANEVQARLKNMQKKKRRRRKNAAAVVVLIIALGIVSGVAVYMYYVNTSDFNTASISASAVPTPSATAAIPVQIVTIAGENPGSPMPQITPASGTAAVSPNADGYIETNIDGVTFGYPRGYESKAGDDGAYLSLKDIDSDAVIKVYEEDTSSPAKDLMKAYSDTIRGTVTESLAGDDWYSITISNGSETYHRCGVIYDGRHIYYEMRYPSASEKEGEYRESTEYMDDYFTEK